MSALSLWAGAGWAAPASHRAGQRRLLTSRRGRCLGRGLPRPRAGGVNSQLHPLVDPQLAHFMQVPLRTIVNWPHSGQLSPS